MCRGDLVLCLRNPALAIHAERPGGLTMAQSQTVREGQPRMLMLQMPSVHGAVPLLGTGPSGHRPSANLQGVGVSLAGPRGRLGSGPGSTLHTLLSWPPGAPLLRCLLHTGQLPLLRPRAGPGPPQCPATLRVRPTPPTGVCLLRGGLFAPRLCFPEALPASPSFLCCASPLICFLPLEQRLKTLLLVPLQAPRAVDQPHGRD